ncbi:MAG: cell division protein FtsL [Clostridia bacterium]|nr:cell division protein FtsL [Clostridia bacterium]
MAPLRQEDYFYEDYEIKKPKINSQPPKTLQKPKAAVKKQEKRKVKRRVFWGTFTFAVALAIVCRYAMINNMNMETIRLKKQLTELNNMNAQLQLNAEKSLNLSEVEKYASETLGLQKPQNYQIEYIKVAKQDLINNKATNENKTGLEKILFNIVEFFN